MTTYFNATPHPINVYSSDAYVFDKASRKNILLDGATPVLSVPPSGIVLNANFGKETTIVEGITFSKSTLLSVDPLPNTDCDAIIVSKMYKDSQSSNPQLITVDGVIFDESGKPCGCTGFWL
jgi:hypothetical protein